MAKTEAQLATEYVDALKALSSAFNGQDTAIHNAVDAEAGTALGRVIVSALVAAGAGPPAMFQALTDAAFNLPAAWATVTDWDAAELEDTGFTFDAATGVLTVDAAGRVELHARIQANQATANRTGIRIRLQEGVGAGWATVAEDYQYSVRNATLNEGSAQISGYLRDVDAAATFRLQARYADTVAAVAIGDGRISAKLWT